MSSTLVILLLVGAVSAITALDSVSSANEKLAAAFSLRANRTGTSSRDDLCVEPCVREWHKGLRREQVPGATLGPYAGRIDADQLEKVCKVFGRTKMCLGKCPASDDKEIMDKTLAHIKYMCIDSTYKRHVQCIHGAAVEMQTACDSVSKCGPFKLKLDGYDQTSPENQEQLKDRLKNMCQLMKCSRDCVKGTVVRKCGQAAQDDLAGLVVKGLEFIKYMVKEHGIAGGLPQECQSTQ